MGIPVRQRDARQRGLTTPSLTAYMRHGVVDTFGGADYLGFVFFPRSPRYVDLATAASLASLVPSGVLRVGLVVDAKTDFLNSLVTAVPLDMLQLHGGESPSRVAEIRESFGLPQSEGLRLPGVLV